MCAKVISISSTCWATYNNQKTKKFTSSIHFNHYFWLTGEFQIYQTKVANFAPSLGGPTAEGFQLQGGRGASPPPDP